jgi:hypothetical protein
MPYAEDQAAQICADAINRVVGVHTTSVQNLSLTYYTHNSLAVSEGLFCV